VVEPCPCVSIIAFRFVGRVEFTESITTCVFKACNQTTSRRTTSDGEGKREETLHVFTDCVKARAPIYKNKNKNQTTKTITKPRLETVQNAETNSPNAPPYASAYIYELYGTRMQA
jgi:hypothetical protein